MTDVHQIKQAARNGEPGAVEALVRSTYADVWRLCSLLVERDAADDLAQETFARALRALARYRGDASARTWILAIARRTCADELRRRARGRRRDGRIAAETATATTAPDPAAAATMSLLAALDPDRRAAFVLTQLFRLSYEEAAVVCDCPQGTIRSRVARARAQLIDLLEPDEVPKRERDEVPKRERDEVPKREPDEVPKREPDEVPKREPDEVPKCESGG